ncbi:hypothetical protein E4U52_005389 [Claviceps spartinae]|nr:hypothetical protein E4U52_005389 [Claviceps spartinae]
MALAMPISETVGGSSDPDSEQRIIHAAAYLHDKNRNNAGVLALNEIGTCMEDCKNVATIADMPAPGASGQPSDTARDWYFTAIGPRRMQVLGGWT